MRGTYLIISASLLVFHTFEIVFQGLNQRLNYLVPLLQSRLVLVLDAVVRYACLVQRLPERLALLLHKLKPHLKLLHLLHPSLLSCVIRG